MLIPRHASLLLLYLFFSTLVYSQENPVKFGSVNAGDFNLTSPVIDSNSNAVIIFDKGDISFEGNTKGWFTYILKRSTRIKIINNKGFDLATIELLMYRNEDASEKIDNLSGTTYNIDNGKIIETNLNTKDIFEEKADKNHFIKKFTMPAVKEGSIIEYSYTFKSDFIYNLPSWEFQSSQCPTLWSEYTVAIPGLLNYMSVSQGFHKFDIDKSGESYKNFLVRRTNTVGGSYSIGAEENLTVSSPVTLHRWVIKNTPALYAENYIFSPSNFIDKLSFQLYKTYDGESYHDVSNTWDKVSEELMKREDFGLPVTNENYWLDKLLPTIVEAGDNRMQKAKKIYAYVQKNYTCTEYHNKFIKTSLQDVVKKKSGSVGDINLLLIAMLNHAGINAAPVLLSTTGFGRNSITYPLMEKLDYVIGKVNIDFTDYYVDATNPFLPFGKLPLNCYNGHARVIANSNADIYFEPDSLREQNSTSVFIINNDNNELEGTITDDMGFFESLNTREAMAKSSLDKYGKELQTQYPENMQISNVKIDSLDQQENNAAVKYDFKLPLDNAEIIYFNPIVTGALKKNPFYAADRKYPVEMPYTTDKLYC